jgi:predicted deacetylase
MAMSAAMKPALCVVIHDVADARLAGCERVLAAVREVAPVALTLLAVPRFHHTAPTRALEAWLGARSRQGDELALHGYTHLDEGRPHGALDRLRRRVYTRGEGEFWDIDVETAATRLRAGIAWFACNGWPLRGFVAPAWLLGTGAWSALQAERFVYTATLRDLHLLRDGGRITSQAIVYSSASAWRRASSIAWASTLAALHGRNPVLRLELHPHDADHAGVRRSWQRLLERALRERDALTVTQVCERWRRTTTITDDGAAAAPPDQRARSGALRAD